MQHWLGAILLATLGLSGCVSQPSPKTAPSDWLEFQAKRRESVAGTNGWTTLVGLHWLHEGVNSAGSDPTNQVVLPRSRVPASIGTFTRSGKEVRFTATQGVPALIDGQTVTTTALRSDAADTPTRLQVGGLQILVLERGERMALRVRDPLAPARLHFPGMRYFPYSSAWRIEGRFEPAPSPRQVQVMDVTGGTQKFSCPGVVVFPVNGVEHRLEVFDEAAGEPYFVIFHDETAGGTTYGGGRFLYVQRPDVDRRVVVDFNRAYNPPCAVTPFATCPRPPAENRLPIAIPAGEQDPHWAH